LWRTREEPLFTADHRPIGHVTGAAVLLDLKGQPRVIEGKPTQGA
jgi:hypothetical protein